MVAPVQYFEALSGDLPVTLDRLIAIGVDAEGDALAAIARLAELRAKKLRGVGLGKEPGLEIDAGRKIVIRVGRARETVNAAMLATLVRIDRLREADIGRVVAGDDRARRMNRDRGLASRRIGIDLACDAGIVIRRFCPAIVHGFAHLAAEAIGGIERGTAAFFRRGAGRARNGLVRRAGGGAAVHLRNFRGGHPSLTS